MRFSLCKECGNCTLIEIIRTVEAHSITDLVSGEKRRIERSRIPADAMRLYPRFYFEKVMGSITRPAALINSQITNYLVLDNR